MRTHRGNLDGFAVISITDEVSGIRFLEIEMDLVQFGLMVSCPTPVPIEFDARGLDKLGWQRQSKIVLVPFSAYSTYSDKAVSISEALIPYEVDGWAAHTSDLTNGHRNVKNADGSFQRVGFFRHIPPGHKDWDHDE